jgi:hypothetical protein
MAEISEIVGEFDEEHGITDIILLGLDGSIRRIVLNEEGEAEDEMP